MKKSSNKSKTRKPSHPGVVFKKLILEELGISIVDAAKLLKLPRSTMSYVLNDRGRLTPEMAKRFAKFTNTSVASWYNMQTAVEIWEVENSWVAEDVERFSAFGD